MEEGIRQQLVANRAAPALRHVALIQERARRLVDPAELALLLVRAAAGVAHFSGNAPRQLTLHADRELIDIRHLEVWVRVRDAAAEERPRTEAASRRLLHT